MPSGESIEALASHGSTLVIFLSIDRIEELVERLMTVRNPETPAAVVARASWDNEAICRGTLATIAGQVRKAKIVRQALLVLGDVLDPERRKTARSRLYAADFSHGFRDGKNPGKPPS
jgi:precorrin-4/cobalt-precorrin-4 C11-methyltransferase